MTGTKSVKCNTRNHGSDSQRHQHPDAQSGEATHTLSRSECPTQDSSDYPEPQGSTCGTTAMLCGVRGAASAGLLLGGCPDPAVLGFDPRPGAAAPASARAPAPEAPEALAGEAAGALSGLAAGAAKTGAGPPAAPAGDPRCAGVACSTLTLALSPPGAMGEAGGGALAAAVDTRARSGVNPGEPPSAPERTPETLASPALGEVGVRDGKFCGAATWSMHVNMHCKDSSSAGSQQPAWQRIDVADQRVRHTK